ncbi:hypothetical protein Dda_1629 [Drechslerella dactyloides]|uniref:Peptidase S8/S53 domain-containing protein n=1 Tax=Drechslerella dactyloides TaxID=74499 RepID=A0AAD6J4E0_DREDA|nr:hypothetical protein Dda_1629 [Drechslerella dactyloides]
MAIHRPIKTRRILSKIGTLDQYALTYNVILKQNFRKDAAFKRNLLRRVHEEIADIKFQDWIFTGGFPADEQHDEDHSPAGYHGTPVVGKLSGRITGVAQKASIVMVKIFDGRGEWKISSTIGGFIKIYDHIKRENADRNSAPTVAGIIATWLAAGIEFNQVIPHMLNLSYPRTIGGPNTIFNNIGINRWPAAQQPKWYKANPNHPPPPPVPLNGHQYPPLQYSTVPIYIVGVLEKLYRHDRDFKDLLLEWANAVSLPPRKLSFHLMETSDLGLLALSISFPPESRDHEVAMMWDAIAEGPRGVNFEDVKNHFWNFKDPGMHQVVYVLDSGCDLEHPEMQDVFFQDWIFPGEFPADEAAEYPIIALNQLLWKYHGTSVIGKIAGKYTGVAQEAEIVGVVMNDGRAARSHLAVVDGLAQIYDHIKKYNRFRNCIINLSIGITRDIESKDKSYNKDMMDIMLEILKSLISLNNVIIVAAAGNEDKDVMIDHYPALFRPLLPQKFIMVGGYVDYTGGLYGQTKDLKGKIIDITAPAEYVKVATKHVGDKNPDCSDDITQPRPGDEDWKRGLCLNEGTSYAAPLVAGVMATWLAAGIDIDDVVGHMHRLAHPRIKGGETVIYNGIGIDRWPREKWPTWYRNGDLPPPPPDPRTGEFPAATVSLSTLLASGKPVKTKTYVYRPTPTSTITRDGYKEVLYGWNKYNKRGLQAFESREPNTSFTTIPRPDTKAPKEATSTTTAL